MSRSVFLSIGSNVNPEIAIPACIEKLKKTFSAKHFSSVYETSPVGPAGNKKFWNLAAEIETADSRDELQRKLREIETSLGRTRHPDDKFAPRTIDIDILPQAGYRDFAFIMIPLAEIAPDAKDDESGETFSKLAGKLAKEAESFRKVLPAERV